MESLPLIKLFMDIALAGTVMYLAFRVVRSRGPSPAQITSLQALEESLVRLLREAGNANTDLQKALAKEQKRLEELLFDIETVEHRVNKGIREAQTVQRDLKRAFPEPEAAPRYEVPAVPLQPADRAVAPQVVLTPGVVAPVPQQFIAPTEYPLSPQQTRAPESESREQAFTKRQPSYAAASEVPRRPLRDSIERRGSLDAPRMEKSQPYSSDMISQPRTVQGSLEDIYARCEELLRAGASIQQVANVMSMTVDEIQTLQQVMEVEDDPNIAATQDSREASYQRPVGGKQEMNDPRLGVLAKAGSSANPIHRTREMVR